MGIVRGGPTLLPCNCQRVPQIQNPRFFFKLLHHSVFLFLFLFPCFCDSISHNLSKIPSFFYSHQHLRMYFLLFLDIFFFCSCLVGASIFAFEFSNFYLKRTECILWFFSFLFIWFVLQFCWVWCLLCFWVFFDVSFSLTFLMLFGCWENIGSWSPWFRTNHFVGKEFS